MIYFFITNKCIRQRMPQKNMHKFCLVACFVQKIKVVIICQLLFIKPFMIIDCFCLGFLCLWSKQCSIQVTFI